MHSKFIGLETELIKDYHKAEEIISRMKINKILFPNQITNQEIELEQKENNRMILISNKLINLEEKPITKLEVDKIIKEINFLIPSYEFKNRNNEKIEYAVLRNEINDIFSSELNNYFIFLSSSLINDNFSNELLIKCLKEFLQSFNNSLNIDYVKLQNNISNLIDNIQELEN